MSKILIAVPTYETIYPDTFKSIYDLDKGGHDVEFLFVRGYDCATARNNIVLEAQKLKVDYVFMVDNDVVLPKDALINFVTNPMLVNLGYCAHRTNGEPFTGRTTICKFGETNYTTAFMYNCTELHELRKNNIARVQVHGGGLACAFIDMKVFEKIQFPWFDWVNYANNEHLSEDLFFCEQCHKHNIPIYVDTRVNCGHMFRYVQFV